MKLSQQLALRVAAILFLSTSLVQLTLTKPTLQQHPVRQDLVEEIKRLTTSWIPMEANENILGDTPVDQLQSKLGYIESLAQKEIIKAGSIFQQVFSKISHFGEAFMGLKLASDSSKDLHKKVLSEKYIKLKQEENITIPLEFDGREKWPQCIHGIRDQQLCGSCWAFASSAFLSDRFCIASEGQINEVLSPQDLISCNFENFGCGGGQLIETIDYLIYEGIVSEKCQPYLNQDSYCKYRCFDSKQDYTKYYCKKNSMLILSDPEEIQLELMTNGPMMVGLTIYEDFLNYKEGVYEYTVGQQVGGHAIKLVGWGHTEKGDLYWKCQNQWGDQWGNGGFINIKAREIGMDSMVMGCLPDVSIVN